MAAPQKPFGKLLLWLLAGAAAVALAWLIAQPGITAPIASATSSAQLDALIAATNLTLEASSLQQLSDASRP